MRKYVFSLSVLATVVVLLPLMMVSTAVAFNCLHALQDVIPCQDYLVDSASKPSDECCKGVKNLATIADESKSQRQSLCRCLKAAQRFPINQSKAEAMPKLCHVHLNVTLSPHVDCNKV